MREIFPPKVRGQVLTADLINKIGKAAERSSKVNPTSNTNGYASSSGVVQIAHQMPFMSPVEVTSEEDDGTLLVRVLEWDGTEWSTDDDAGPYALDPSMLDSGLSVGSRVYAIWHPVREAFVPFVSGVASSPTAATLWPYCHVAMQGATFTGRKDNAGLDRPNTISPTVFFALEKQLGEGWVVCNWTHALALPISYDWPNGVGNDAFSYVGGSNSTCGMHCFVVPGGIHKFRVSAYAFEPDTGSATISSSSNLRISILGTSDDRTFDSAGYSMQSRAATQDAGGIQSGVTDAVALGFDTGGIGGTHLGLPVVLNSSSSDDGPWIAVSQQYVTVRLPDASKFYAIEAEIDIEASWSGTEEVSSGSADSGDSSMSSLSTSSSSRSSSSLSSQSVSSQSSASSASSISSQSSSSSSNSSSSSSFSTSSSSLSSKSSISTSSSSHSSSGIIR